MTRSVARVVVITLLIVALALSGCVAKKDDGGGDQVLRERQRASQDTGAEEFQFTVPEGTERIVLLLDTSPTDEESGIPGCPWCEAYDPQGGNAEDPTGSAQAEIDGPDGSEYNLAAPFDSSDRITVDDPAPGTYSVDWWFGEYDGPARFEARSDGAAAAAANQPLIGGSFWDITGVILALLTIVGGVILYRRRSRFLTRELHRIDSTVRVYKDDVDECRTNLVGMQDHIKELLARRKIEENQYLILERRIDRYLEDLDTPGNRHKASAEDEVPLEWEST